jgi:hypothetical protein
MQQKLLYEYDKEQKDHVERVAVFVASVMCVFITIGFVGAVHASGAERRNSDASTISSSERVSGDASTPAGP